MKPKIIAMYLPQYHQIPENDMFWGKGFTDWTTVRNAKPLYTGHVQPREPLNDNYYDLSLKDNVEWQVELARKYGIYGFGIYHYWFNSSQCLLTKPAEIIRDNKNLDLFYFFAWDNASWRRSWGNVPGNAWAPIADSLQGEKGPQTLIPFVLGGEQDWEIHYNYLRDFFSDPRYIKIEGKPVFSIWKYDSKIGKMCSYLDKLAKKDGYPGIFIIFRYGLRVPRRYTQLVYEPITSGWTDFPIWKRIINRCFLKNSDEKGLKEYDYSIIWNKIISKAKKRNESHIFHGAFVSYDDTPRRGMNGNIVKGGSPTVFKKYFNELVEISKKQNKEFIFLTAWNEWGEGAFLEPDKIFRYQYLEAIRDVINKEEKE